LFSVLPDWVWFTLLLWRVRLGECCLSHLLAPASFDSGLSCGCVFSLRVKLLRRRFLPLRCSRRRFGCFFPFLLLHNVLGRRLSPYALVGSLVFFLQSRASKFSPFLLGFWDALPVGVCQIFFSRFPFLTRNSKEGVFLFARSFFRFVRRLYLKSLVLAASLASF